MKKESEEPCEINSEVKLQEHQNYIILTYL